MSAHDDHQYVEELIEEIGRRLECQDVAGALELLEELRRFMRGD